MKLFTIREVRQALVGKGNLRTLLSDRITDWDPYQPGSFEKFNLSYRNEALQGWQRARQLLHELPAIDALENTWACIEHLQDLRDFLYIGVLEEDDLPTVQRANQLFSLSTLNPIDDEWFLGILVKGSQHDTADLLPLKGFSGAVRIRWGLAHRVKCNAPLLELLKCAGALESFPVKQASLLLNEALSHHSGFKPKKITSAEATTLSDAEFAVLVSDPQIFKKVYTKGSAKFEVMVEEVGFLRAKYAHDLVKLDSIFSQLSQRNWFQAGQLAMDIVVDAPAYAAASRVKHLMGDITEVANRQFKNDWLAMPEKGYAVLVKLFGKSKLPAHWLLDAVQLARQLIGGQLPVRSLSPLDIAQLGKTWNLETKRALIAAKCYKAVEVTEPAWSDQAISVLIDAACHRPNDGDELLWQHLHDFKNAEEILKALVTFGSKRFSLILQQVVSGKFQFEASRSKAVSWEEFISSQIGAKSWRAAVQKRLITKATISQLTYAVIKSGTNSKTDDFVTEASATLRRTRRATHSDAVSVMRWLDARPADADYIAPNLTTSLNQKICALRPGDCSVQSIRRLYAASPQERKADLWHMQLNHVTDADHLIELALEGAVKGWQFEWNPRWKSVGGTVQQKARALVLMTRTDLHRLRQLRRLYTEEVISEALRWVTKQLPSASAFEIIFLELTSCLGLRHGASLRWLLSIRNREKPAGAKFDQLYAKHEIPKKSGKMRLISAPNGGLKRIQRSITVTLLNPLGAHDAAFGFVTGRSIVGNATLHVGKTIVVNADVSNCFPSVRWPLVRAALMRDFSDRLSPLSISFLVDLCTAEGVLPVGAPTSPAILNRVLYKTDQILSEQAALRGCTYSRYADDITFSGDDKAVTLLGVAKGVLGKIGLELDPKKTNIFRRGRRQMCTGLVVNDHVNVPRTIRKKVRAAVHAFEQGRPLVWMGEYMSPSSLRGRLEFLKMVTPDTAAPLVKRLDSAQAIKSKKKIPKLSSPTKTGGA